MNDTQYRRDVQEQLAEALPVLGQEALRKRPASNSSWPCAPPRCQGDPSLASASPFSMGGVRGEPSYTASWPCGKRTRRRKMDRNEQKYLVNHLEAAPHLVPAFVETVRAMIAELMDEIYKSPDAEDRMQLVAIKYRARMILDRWKQREAN